MRPVIGYLVAHLRLRPQYLVSREPGENPGLSRSGIGERRLQALASQAQALSERMGSRSPRRVRRAHAPESEYLSKW